MASVTHPDRPHLHLTESTLRDMATTAGLSLTRLPDRPAGAGQVLWLRLTGDPPLRGAG